MKAEDVMTTRVITITEDQSKQQAARLLSQHRISGLPVVNADHVVVGVVTLSSISFLGKEGKKERQDLAICYDEKNQRDSIREQENEYALPGSIIAVVARGVNGL